MRLISIERLKREFPFTYEVVIKQIASYGEPYGMVNIRNFLERNEYSISVLPAESGDLCIPKVCKVGKNAFVMQDFDWMSFKKAEEENLMYALRHYERSLYTAQ